MNPDALLTAAWVALAILPPLLGLWRWPSLTRAILSDLRVPRILYYVCLACLGTAIAWQAAAPGFLPSKQLIPVLAKFAIVLAYAAVYAIVGNNLADQASDRISSPWRPLVSGRVQPRPYLIAGLICQAWALLLAAFLGWPAFLGTCAISLGYAVYSLPPLRLKRVPVVAKLILALNAWAVVLAGHSIAGADLFDFPIAWTLWVLGPLAIAANFIDLKDIEGDRAAGIPTLPVLLGESYARIVIGIGTAICYIMAGRLIDIPLAWLLCISALAIHLGLLVRKPYDERPIFAMLIASLLGLCFFLMLSHID